MTIAVEEVSKMDNNLSLARRKIKIAEQVEKILCCRCQAVTGKKIGIQNYSGRCPSRRVKGLSEKKRDGAQVTSTSR